MEPYLKPGIPTLFQGVTIFPGIFLGLIPEPEAHCVVSRIYARADWEHCGEGGGCTGEKSSTEGWYKSQQNNP